MLENNLDFFKNTLDTTKNDFENEDYVLIEIANKIYGIKTVCVLEITKIAELDYPNTMPSCILGLLKYEQEPIPVIDIREIFKNDRIVYGLGAKLVVIKTSDKIVSIVCDKVKDIKKLNKNMLHNIPYQMNDNLYDALYVNKDENIYLLNVDNVVQYINNNPEKFRNDDIKQQYIINDELSKNILHERKNFLPVKIGEIQTNKPLYDRGVSFLIDSVKYYINMASVKEFYKVNNLKLIKVPYTPDYILGLINIKGDYITILDIRNFYQGLYTQIKEKSTIIILNSEEFKIGILADEICESMDIDFDEIVQNKLQTQDENKITEFVRNNEIYQILDINQLLLDDRLVIT